MLYNEGMQWEYLKLTVNNGAPKQTEYKYRSTGEVITSNLNEPFAISLVVALDNLGDEGWELVTTLPEQTLWCTHTLLFKRPLALKG